MTNTYNIHPKTPMSKEEVERRIKKAMISTNIVYIVTDALDTFLLDACSTLDSLGLELKHEEKRKFNEMKNHIHKAHYYSEQFAQNLYRGDSMKKIADASHDSDWWYLMIKLLYDRLGDNKQKTHMLLEFLDRMPSEGFFKISIDDFLTETL